MNDVYVPRENVNDDSVIINLVHFSSGSIVKKGQVVVEIETSKTSIEIDIEQRKIKEFDLLILKNQSLINL